MFLNVFSLIDLLRATTARLFPASVTLLHDVLDPVSLREPDEEENKNYFELLVVKVALNQCCGVKWLPDAEGRGAAHSLVLTERTFQQLEPPGFL